MADIRCPMCGKPNDASLDVCQYCQARLKPLIAGGGSGKPAGENRIEDEKTQPRQEDTGGDDIPDWLSSLRPAASDKQSTPAYTGWTFPETTPASSGEASGQDPDEQDWLSSLRQRSDLEGENLPAGDESPWPATGSLEDKPMPDWLQDLRPAAPQAPAAGDAQEYDESDEPDWLRRVRERQRQGLDDPNLPETDEISTPDFDFQSKRVESRDLPPPSVASTLDDNEIPDWLSGLGDSASDDDAPGLPGWLADEPKGQAPAPVDNSLPDWLSGAARDTKPPTPPVDFGLQAPPAREPVKPLSDDDGGESQIPSWLTNFVTSDVPEKTEEKPPVEDAYPSWLGELEKNSTLVQPGALASEPAGDDFDWMGQQPDEPAIPLDEPLPAVGEGGKSISPFTLEDDDETFVTSELPDWLKGVSADAHPEAQAGSETDSSLSPADLPVWLEAMRPVEAITATPVADENDQVVEGSGPLTGLRGILRAEPDIARQKKPAAYTIKLQVAESHQQHVDMLEALLKAEGTVTPVTAGAPVTSRQILRWLIFVVMALAVIWPLFNASQEVPLPLMPSEAIDARGIIGSLPDGSPVLVAVEYEPGYAGELDAAAASIMDHLMIKGAYLVLVSTSPVGPAQAERLIRSVNQSAGHSYSSDGQPVGQYTNLGFIPGGASGLQGFALAPARILPYSLEGLTWESGPLASIHSLADFGAVLVITENPDTARAWVEQVQPALAGKPLVMVVSAQAEALVRPYYDANPRQIQGMVVGVAGGAGYESNMSRTGLARRYWDALSYGATAAILLMVGAGVVNLVAALLPARRKKEGDLSG